MNVLAVELVEQFTGWSLGAGKEKSGHTRGRLCGWGRRHFRRSLTDAARGEETVADARVSRKS